MRFIEIASFDAQWKNNKERLPLWILAAQSASFETIPGFVLVTQDASEVTITAALQKVKELMLSAGAEWKSCVMIDKDRAEWNSIRACGLRPFLCQFHVMKALYPEFKLLPSEAEKANAMLLFKRVARSKSDEETDVNIAKMKAGVKHNVKFWATMKKNWLCPEWIGGWIDVDRPGGRVGIYNTNNPSESWFKQLLRTYLQGRTGYSMPLVIQLVIETILPATELHMKQRMLGIGRRPENPSAREQRLLEERAKSRLKSSQVTFERETTYIVRGGRAAHRCQVIPSMMCDCIKFLWHGRECIHCCILRLSNADSELVPAMEDIFPSERDASLERLRPGPIAIAPPQRRAARVKPGRKKLLRFAATKQMLFDQASNEPSERDEEDNEILCELSGSSDETLVELSESTSDGEWHLSELED